jgi:hypothetical protein
MFVVVKPEISQEVTYLNFDCEPAVLMVFLSRSRIHEYASSFCAVLKSSLAGISLFSVQKESNRNIMIFLSPLTPQFVTGTAH